MRGGDCGDVNPEDTAKLADGAIEDPARVMVVMCAELDDAPIMGEKGTDLFPLSFSVLLGRDGPSRWQIEYTGARQLFDIGDEGVRAGRLIASHSGA